MNLTGLKINLWAEIDASYFKNASSAVRIDIGRFSCDFSLNTIPTAIITVAPGTRVNDLQAALVHQATAAIKVLVPISVFLVVTPLTPGALKRRWPTTPFRVFNGYITGKGSLRSENSAELTFNLIHWLSDLNFSSILSRTFHPSNPGELAFHASYANTILGGQATGAVATPTAALNGLFPGALIFDDLWAGNKPNTPGLGFFGIKGLFTALSQQDNFFFTIDAAQAKINNNPTNFNGNWEAQRALARIEPFASYQLSDQTAINNETGYVDSVPIKLKTNSQNTAVIRSLLAKNIQQEITRYTLDQMGSQTIWDKIATYYCSEYQLAIVPMVEKALITPFCPGLRWKTAKGSRYISSQDYTTLDYPSNLQRPLRGVFLMTRSGTATGLGQSAERYIGYGPHYVSKDARNLSGQVLYRTTPMWLAGTKTWNDYDGKPVGNVIARPVGPDNPPPSSSATYRELWDAFARSIYLQEYTRGRTIRLTGRLRFDIAPGTNVRIQTEDKTKSIPVVLESDYFGTVSHVTIDIDAVSKKVATSLQVIFVTDEAEQSSSDATTDSHPIWEEPFWGAPLVVLQKDGDVFRHDDNPGMAPSLYMDPNL